MSNQATSFAPAPASHLPRPQPSHAPKEPTMSTQTDAPSTCPSTTPAPTSTRQAYRPEGSPITLYPTSTEAIEREIIDPLAVFIDNCDLGGRKEVPTYFDVEAIAYHLLTTYTTAEGGVAYGLEEVLPDGMFWEVCDERAR